MDKKEKQTLQRAINYKNYNASPVKKPAMDTEKTADKKQEEKPFIKPVTEIRDLRRYTAEPAQEGMVTQERLQEAIIWSEILGKPLSKRRKRR